MSYLVAWSADKKESVAIEMQIGEHLATYKRRIASELHEQYGDSSDKIELMTISRPAAYGEYAPYRFAETEDEFEDAVRELIDN